MAERMLEPTAGWGEDEEDVGIRPRYLNDFQGQKELKDNLYVFIKAAIQRKESLDHVFISGPPGFGENHVSRYYG